MKILSAGRPAVPLEGPEREKVLAFFSLAEVQAVIPQVKHEVWVEYYGPVAPGTPLTAAHRLWTFDGLIQTDYVGKDWRKPAHFSCPEGLVKLGICAADKMSGGMGSFYGFEGYYISMLVDLEARTVWDARGDKAS